GRKGEALVEALGRGQPVERGLAEDGGIAAAHALAREALQHALEARAREMDGVEQILVQLVLAVRILARLAVAEAGGGLAQAVRHEDAERVVEARREAQVR